MATEQHVDDGIPIIEDAGEQEVTQVAPPALVQVLTAGTREQLGPEARSFAERVRYVLAMEFAWPHDSVDELIARATALMPGGRR